MENICQKIVRHNRAGSVDDSEETIPADEIARRIIDAIGPAPKLGHLIAAENLVDGLGCEISDGVDLVVVLATEDDLTRGGDVEVLEGPRTEVVAAAEPPVGFLRVRSRPRASRLGP